MSCWETRKININVIIRLLIGCLFIFSGSEKLIGPYQNFLYVVQSYSFLTVTLEEIVARVLPWVELFLGVFLVLGLCLKWTLRGLACVIAMFLIVVSQALVRHLPITECGCFGDLVTFPLHVVLLLDSILLLLIGFLIWKIERTISLSLDKYFIKNS